MRSRYKQNPDALCTDRFPFQYQVPQSQAFQAEMLGYFTKTLIKIIIFTTRQIICVTDTILLSAG
jgi:hypothetical protein